MTALHEMEPAEQNATRAGWARDAVDTFAHETFNRPWGDLVEGDRDDCLADLLCNLRHFAKEEGLDFEAADARGSGHFDYESSPDYQGD